MEEAKLSKKKISWYRRLVRTSQKKVLSLRHGIKR
jgi:hypothetical protein